MRYIESLRNGIEKTIVEKNAYIIGEDIQEPYGGAFKVTKGLSEKYPDNIIGTPMTEQGFAALGIGMALYGCHVSVEIMFGDFITLLSDQIINHAAKFRELYNSEMHLVFRFPSGGYRGYGATHSQSIEKIFMGIPGVRIVAPSVLCDPGQLFVASMQRGVPTLFVENKLDYPRDMITEMTGTYSMENYGEEYPVVRVTPVDERADATIVTYGGMVPMAIEVMEHMLYEEEINVEIIAVSDLLDMECVDKYKTTYNIIILEEGVCDFGWGAEVCAFLSERHRIRCKRVGAQKRVIPVAQKAEAKTLPGKERVIKSIYEVLK